MAGPNERLELEITIQNNQANVALSQLNAGFSNAEKSALQFAQRSSKDFQNASQAAQMLSAQVGIVLPEGLRRAIAESKNLGPLLTSAFSASVYVAAGVAVVAFADKLGLIPPEIKKVFEAQKDWTEETKKTRKEIGDLTTDLGKAAEAFAMIGQSETGKLRIQMGSASDREAAGFKEIASLSKQFSERAEKAVIAASIRNNVGLQTARNLTAEILQKDTEYQNILAQVEKAQMGVTVVTQERLTLQKQLNLLQQEESVKAAEKYAAAMEKEAQVLRDATRRVLEFKVAAEAFNPSLIENAKLIDEQIRKSTPEMIEAPEKRALDSFGGSAVADAFKNAQGIWDAQRDYAQKRISEIRDAAGHIFDDLMTGSKNIWQDLLRSFENIFLAPVRMAFQSLAQSLFFGRSGGGGLLGSMGGMLGGALGPGGTAPFLSSATGGTGGLLSKAMGGLGLSGLFGGGAAAAAPSVFGTSGMISGMSGVSTSAAAGTGGGLGASLGAFFTNPWTIGIGAGLLAGFAIWRLFRESPEEKMKKKIKALYGVNIEDKGILRQLVQLAQGGFGGSFDRAIRSAQVRDMVEQYAAQTGQTMRGARAQMTGSTLVESGGGLYQAANYSNGSLMASSGGLPGLSLDSISGSGASSGTINITVKADVKEFLEKGVITAVAKNPRVVANANVSTSKSNYNRRELTALQLAPGTLTS